METDGNEDYEKKKKKLFNPMHIRFINKNINKN